MRNLLLSLLLFALPAPQAMADAQERLESFIQGTKSLKARFTQTVSDKTGFTQTVSDKTGRKTQEATGNLFFSRPGKFRWVYQKPYAQLIVGDGSKLWIYDEDLGQVTVRALDQALGDSPAALLAGDNDIAKLFNLKETGVKDGLDWLEATPKSKESGFESVRLGFRGKDIQAMELKDNFGQTTLLRFSNLERNPTLGGSLFRFTPPKGVDILGER
ncbi:MAG: outer membrane lipoprotein chaperone LolA [Betaproteobacteria bacterium]|nr:outer membrane lipoprotein chaperone LolA [Betaproteobacteria bacterium]